MAAFDEVNVQLKFRVVTPKGEYQDAIYMKKSEYEAKTAKQLADLKQARVDKWVNRVIPTPVELTKEQELAQIQDELDALAEDKAALELKKASLTAR